MAAPPPIRGTPDCELIFETVVVAHSQFSKRLFRMIAIRSGLRAPWMKPNIRTGLVSGAYAIKQLRTRQNRSLSLVMSGRACPASGNFETREHANSNSSRTRFAEVMLSAAI